jgi:hypothetical protein
MVPGLTRPGRLGLLVGSTASRDLKPSNNAIKMTIISIRRKGLLYLLVLGSTPSQSSYRLPHTDVPVNPVGVQITGISACKKIIAGVH